LDAAYFAVGEADLDAVGVGGAVGEYLFDGALGEFAGPLVLLKHYEYLCAWFDVGSGAAGGAHCLGWLRGGLYGLR
jgi:hypothetical protein